MTAHIGQQSRTLQRVFGSGLFTGWIGFSSIVAGCAAAGTSELRGTSGPLAWEVTNIGQIASADQRRIRWSYTIVLKETASSKIQFERVERGMYAPGTDIVNRVQRTDTFDRRLDPGGELRLNYVDTWGWRAGASVPFGGTAQLGGVTVERRYLGKTDRGATVDATIRLYLDRGVGKPGRQPRTEPLSPARSLEPDGLKSLTGTWLGHYRAGEYDIPLEVVVSETGSFEAGENDPVTTRFTGSLSVLGDGQIYYLQRGDTARLTLHEGGGRRVLVGTITGTRSGQTIAWPLRLDFDAPKRP